MRYKRITVTTTHEDSELVSSAMFDVGACGVSVADRQDFIDLFKSDVLWDYVDEDLLKTGDEVRVSTVVAFDDGGYIRRLELRLDQMKAAGGLQYGEIIAEEIDAADWENEWKKYYHPIKTRNVTIVPSWIAYQPAKGERVMRLDPGMAFGTGEHATTRMCLQMMDASGKSVIDVGCGSGILGIAAALCGARSVYMCDIDDQAVGFAKLNAAANGAKCVVEKSDLLETDARADLIFANITADILIRLSRQIGRHLNEGGRIILSGIIDSRLTEVENSYRSAGFETIQRAAEDDWRALEMKRTGE